MNNENLRPFGSMPPEEHRTLSRRGGVASGARRRERSALRRELLELAAGLALAGEVREEYRRRRPQGRRRGGRRER